MKVYCSCIIGKKDCPYCKGEKFIDVKMIGVGPEAVASGAISYDDNKQSTEAKPRGEHS